MAQSKKVAETRDEATRVVLSEGGRIVIPASVRKALGVGPGDSLSLRVEDNELRILSQREAVIRAQEIVSRRIARQGDQRGAKAKGLAWLTRFWTLRQCSLR